MFKKIQKLGDAIREFTNSCDPCQTAVPNLTLYKHIENPIKMPDSSSPYLYLLIAGSLRLYTRSGIMDYVAGQYSISAIDTPSSGYALTFSEQEDFLALSINFTLDDVISVVLKRCFTLRQKGINKTFAAK